jgi:hypothetical protein
MQRIASFTAKIRKADISKIENAIALVENNINLSYLI